MEILKKGEGLFAEGNLDQAERCFKRVLENSPYNKEALNNLGVIAFQRRQNEVALKYFKDSLSLDPFYKSAIINYHDAVAEDQKTHSSLILRRYLERNPEDTEIKELLERNKKALPRYQITFLCLPGLENFLKDIVSYLGQYHDITTCYSSNGKAVEAAVREADIVWLEWANELTVALTNHTELLKDKRVICRLHSYEALVGFPKQIDWTKLDDLIFVADHIREIVQEEVPDISEKVNVHVIPNGVDLNRYPFKERPRGKNIAFLGSINFKKGPMLLLHAFAELIKKDPEYQLYLGGDMQDVRYKLYFDQMAREMGLADKIHFDGWIDDVNRWFEDKHFIACSSVLEGHPVALMEGMARGLKPLVHNFVGARGIYTEGYIWNTIDDFVRLVTEDNYEPKKYRDFIAENFPLERQLHRIENVIYGTTSELGDLYKPITVDKSSTEIREETTTEETTSPVESQQPAWEYPEAMFDHSREVRIKCLLEEASKQINGNRLKLAETTLHRLAHTTGYGREDVLVTLTKIYQHFENENPEVIPNIQNIWKRGALSALESKDYNNFFHFMYLSIYSENFFSQKPNYKFARVDEDFNMFIKLAAERHPLKELVEKNRKEREARPKQTDKIKIGFLLEGLSQFQAPSRTYYPLAEFHNRDKFELYFYSRWALNEPIAQKQEYGKTVDFLKKQDCHVYQPEQPLLPMQQAEDLTRRIVNDEIDVLMYQTTYFVPVYNFISCLHPTPVQTAIEHQQSEFSHEMDLIFTTRKQRPECYSNTSFGVIPFTRQTNFKTHDRRSFGIPETAVVLASLGREQRYDQPEFWQELIRILKENPRVYYLAIGLSSLNGLLPHAASERNRIITPGYRTDVMELLSMADIYLNLFPSGAGSSMIEAMNAGLPVLCFEPNYDNLFTVQEASLGAEFVAHRDLVIPYGDLKQWHHTLKRLIREKDWREQLSREMLERAEHFEPPRMTKAVFDELENLYLEKTGVLKKG